MKAANRRYKLPASNRLKHRKEIESLFHSGKAFSVFPFRCVYMLIENTESTTKVGISIPKKKFPKAVDRNRIKRLTKEAWRLQQHTLSEGMAKQSMHCFLIYIGKNELPHYAQIYNAVTQIIHRLHSKLT